MGGFLGIGGSSAKTDRSMELGGFTNLNNVFNYAMPTAQASLSRGSSDLSTAGDYFKNLLSGNRPATQQAVAPEANAVRASADAQKRQLATSGTARGGGTAGTNQQVNDNTNATVDNAIFAARPGAAKGLTQIGTTESDVGANILNDASTTAANYTSLAQGARKQDYAINQDMVSKVTNFIDQAAAGLFG